jgi:hypothetical protein
VCGDRLDQTRALRDDAPVREHKALDAALAEIEHRLALHGEPVPAADSTTGQPGPVVALQSTPRPDGRPDPVPVLGLRPLADASAWPDTWTWLLEAVNGSRSLIEPMRTADRPARARIAAGAADELLDLARAADQAVQDLAAIRTRRP